MFDPWAILGLSSTGAANPDGGVVESTVWVSKEAVEKFEKEYAWEFVEKTDGSFQVHYYKATK